MSSQKDFFEDKSDNEVGVQTCPSKLALVHNWIVRFHWDEEKEFPFEIVPRKKCGELEIKSKWIDGVINESSRIRKLSKQNYSLFAKIQEGKIISEEAKFF